MFCFSPRRRKNPQVLEKEGGYFGPARAGRFLLTQAGLVAAALQLAVVGASRAPSSRRAASAGPTGTRVVTGQMGHQPAVPAQSPTSLRQPKAAHQPHSWPDAHRNVPSPTGGQAGIGPRPLLLTSDQPRAPRGTGASSGPLSALPTPTRPPDEAGRAGAAAMSGAPATASGPAKLLTL